MKLHRLRIAGFRRLESVEVIFGDATFLIGANNAGKSSVLHAIEALLSVNKRQPEAHYFSEKDSETGEEKISVKTIELEAEFRNVPAEATSWRGFKGRVFNYDIPPDSGETGLSVTYKKIYPLGEDVQIFLRAKKRSKKAAFEGAKTVQDLIDKGLNGDLAVAALGDASTKLVKKHEVILETLDEIWDISEEIEWFENPGGIPANIVSRLPRLLIIPAHSGSEEMDAKTGALGKTLTDLFSDVRKASPNYQKAQEHLALLEKELDPTNHESEFGKLMNGLNRVLRSVFPEAELHATANLSDADSSLKPTFEVSMSSNVRTSVGLQGTGMVRSAVFGMLRYRSEWISRRGQEETRSLLIGFEEPEMYLHPAAAYQMRETIYELSAQGAQIVSTTHSPYMIDLAKKPRQILNSFRIEQQKVCTTAFNVTDEYNQLVENDKAYVKMLLLADESIARVFFSHHALIVEGDTEELVLRESVRRLPKADRVLFNRSAEVVRARGKASIISLVKYFVALGVPVVVIHDRDHGVAGAEKFNAPISAAVGDKGIVIVLEECIEDALGYTAPTSEKPYSAYDFISKNWGDDVESLTGTWKSVFSNLCSTLVPKN